MPSSTRPAAGSRCGGPRAITLWALADAARVSILNGNVHRSRQSDDRDLLGRHTRKSRTQATPMENKAVYRYLTVRSDPRHSAYSPTSVLVDCLESLPGLRRADMAHDESEPGLPGFYVVIASCSEGGNYATHKGRVPQQVNMAELIYSWGNAPAHQAALALAIRLADELDWEVVDTDTEQVLHTGSAPGGTVHRSVRL